MKQLISLFLALLTLTATAQINYPFNPDENADAFISTPDLMEFLVVFGYEWEQEEIQVDSIPLSMYLSSLEAMIEASALPAGTMPGQFLQWDGESWELVMPRVGCTLPEACNYDPTAHVLDEDKCILQDECGVCNGPGAIYDCGCSDIPEGDCDCEGNVVDALGACGGTCAADEDGDGICDDGDSCVGEADECGVCNGPGAIYGCGCSDIPEGACDCAGNVEDILGVCGGGCTADEDGDGICDDVDDCVGEYDGCGVCNGPGPVLGCGCNDIPEGFCDCNGNILDAVGTCGGACQNDINGDGICDDDSIPGCTYDVACNYDPSASINDGSCDYTSCYGCTDIEACNYSPEATIDNGVCWYAAASYDCDYNCLVDSDGDGVCDDLEVSGCTDEEACNFASVATEEDGTCDYCSCADVEMLGCTNPDACNFNEEANCDDASCQYLDECEVCGGTGTLGCTNPLATNYDAVAACDDGSCIVYGCMAELACNFEPTANVEDESCEFGTCPGCTDPNDYSYNPTSTNDETCGLAFEFTNCGAEGRFGPQQIDCAQSYGAETTVISQNGIQIWPIEASGIYRITAIGAAGGVMAGGDGNIRGRGAKMEGLFELEGGGFLVVLVGQMGQDIGCGDCSAGGGGGTFVAYSDSPFNGQPYNSFDLQPLIVAGGGGGAGDDSHGSDAVITEEALCYTCPEPGHGGYSYYGNNGGGGYFSSGNGIVEAVGFGFLQGGRGGQSYNSWGGFGGGSGGSDEWGTAGGGYTGGYACDNECYSGNNPFGGGASFNSGVNQSNVAGYNSGHGLARVAPVSFQ